MTFRDFLHELRRRRVVKVAILYGVVAFGLLQVADLLLPGLNLPDWSYRLLVALVLFGLPIVLVLAWAFDVTPEGVRRTRPRRPAPQRRNQQEEAKTIAVLPFVNMSDGRENEYFSDGITEEILNALVKVKGLRVSSRTSSFAFKGKEVDIREVGEKLAVSTLLEGSIRRAGDRIRITAQLIDVDSGFHLWSETYDRRFEDIFAIQDEISRAIVEALKVQLGAEQQGPLVAPTTGDLEAYTLYLRGRFFMHRGNEAHLRESLRLYEAALARDSTYARAHAGIADAWMYLADDWVAPADAYPRAKSAAERAIQLDETLAEAHSALGKVLGWFYWDFDGGELALRRAVASNPNYADAHWGLGSLLPANGRALEAVEEMRTALRLDPLSPTFSRWLARFLVFARQYEDALAQSRATVELDPDYPYAHLELGNAYLGLGEPALAMEAFRRGAEIGGITYMQTGIAHALVDLRRLDEARELLARLEREAAQKYVRPEAMAGVWARLGEMDRAYALLGDAIAARSAGMIYVAADPAYDALRADPRFADVIARVGVRVHGRAAPLTPAAS